MSKKAAKNRNGRRSEKIVRGRASYAYSKNGETPEGEVNDNSRIYVSARNHEVIFLPMPPMLREKMKAGLNATWPEPEVPTYEVEAAGGDVEVHRHTEKSLVTEEDHAAWDAYTKEHSAWNREFSRRFLRALQIECMNFEEKEGWEKRQKFLGYAIPEDEFERCLHYIETEIIGDANDVAACFTIPLSLAGAEDEVLQAAEELFRAAIRQEAFGAAGTEDSAK